MPYCIECGAEVDGRARFCRQCGSAQVPAEIAGPVVSQASVGRLALPRREHAYIALAAGCALLVVIGAFLPWQVIVPSFSFRDTTASEYLDGFPYAFGTLVAGIAMASIAVFAVNARKPLNGILYVSAAVLGLIVYTAGNADSVQLDRERDALGGEVCDFRICGSGEGSGSNMTLAGLLLGSGIAAARAIHARASASPIDDGPKESVHSFEFFTRPFRRCPDCRSLNLFSYDRCSRCGASLKVPQIPRRFAHLFRGRAVENAPAPRFEPGLADELAALAERADGVGDEAAIDRIRDVAEVHGVDVERFETWRHVVHAIAARRRGND